MPLKLIIFDLDGTILDTLEDLHSSLNFSLTQFSLPIRSLQETRSFIGNGIRRLIELSVPTQTPCKMIHQIQNTFTTHYKIHCNDKTRPYTGIPALIQTVRSKGFLTAVVSNKDDYAVKQLCEQHFPGLFDAVAGSRDGIRKKPAPDSVNSVLKYLGISASEAIYIGDSEVDYYTAVNANMELITVSWGFRDPGFLRKIGCTTIVSTPEELYRLLLG